MEKARILIVDDTPDILRTLELLLQSKYEIILAQDGLIGFAKAIKYLPDLVVLDIMMPKMTGYQFFDQFKKQPSLNDIPIVFLSAKGTPLEQDYGIKKGASAYLAKPFDPKELLVTIENLLKCNPRINKNKMPYEQVLIEEAKEKKVSWKG